MISQIMHDTTCIDTTIIFALSLTLIGAIPAIYYYKHKSFLTILVSNYN
jgi:hypothetical protein